MDFIAFTLLLSLARCSMRITTNITGHEYTIFADNEVSEGVRVGRADPGQCHAVPRLMLGPSSNSMHIQIAGSAGPMDLSGRIHRNSNGIVVSPDITFDRSQINSMFVPQIIQATITFNCSLDVGSDNPWAFIGIEVVDAGRRVEFEVLKICEANFYSFDWSMPVLLALAVLTVLIATLSLVRVSLEIRRDRNAVSEEPRTDLTIGVIVFFVLLASSILIFAFFYPNVFLVIYTICLCIAGTFLIGIYFFQLIQMSTKRCPQLRTGILKKIVYKELTIAEVIGYTLAFFLFIWWLYTKHWILNNIIAFLFVQCLVRIIRVKSLRVATLLLTALFAYDVFWVFLSSWVFGSNVMVTVATKADLPIKILVPYFSPRPTTQCALIGLGDLIVPGLVIAFSYKASQKLKSSHYYVANLLAYTLALVICEVMIHVYHKPQPALLYISPLLLFAFYSVAIWRKEFRKIWKGIPSIRYIGNAQPGTFGRESNREAASLFPTHH
eukprot:TRINITY_DN7433_c0_g1_i30.p1 TRINITY_DN7433_c0_g1~~TRINITY_DN7433_c0_g1_i30.p1  ORF type:complete len:496 (+),score=96.26 TRINITY_DN7433_c0_g1_i30:130-1617(+)